MEEISWTDQGTKGVEWREEVEVIGSERGWQGETKS